MLIGDVFTGLHILLPAVYVCFLFNVALGRRISSRLKFQSVFGMTLLGACVFFLVTNFASWIAFYDHSLNGLIQCYVKGIPWFRFTLVGDLLYSAILFGSLALVESRFPIFRRSLPHDQIVPVT